MLLAERVTPRGDPDRRVSRACTAAELFCQDGDNDTAARVMRRLLHELGPGALRAQCLAGLALAIGEDSEGAAALLHEALRQPELHRDAAYGLRFQIALLLVNLGDLPSSGPRSRA